MGLFSLPLDWNQYLPFGTPPFRKLAVNASRDVLRLHDGTVVTLRAATQEDGELIQDLVRGLSIRTRYQRFFYPVHELTPDMLARFTTNEPTQAMTILATIQQEGREKGIAMAQYVADAYPERCDFAVVVADAWQRSGLGRKLIQTLICMARAAGIERIEGDILAENEPMRRLMLELEFTLRRHEDGAYLRKASKALDVPAWKCSSLTALVTMQERQESMHLAG